MFFKLYIILFIIFIGPLIIGGWFIFQERNRALRIESENVVQLTNSLEASHANDLSLANTVVIPITKYDSLKESPTTPQDILLEVPFTPQAPYAQWDNVIFQNACEEASILMAMRWVEDRSLTKQEAEKEIRAISNFEQKVFGHFHDTSSLDTAQIIKDYFKYQNVDVRIDISAEDIKAELVKGNVVIVPVNGQKLNNPFYTLPGPLEHMIVVIGYDAATEEFITNDPGTRRGEKFRYSEDVLKAALQDYPSGFHEPVIKENKTMIVVSPRF